MATERTGLVAGSEYTRQAQVGDCRVGQTSRQIVTVEQIGQVVRTPDDLYAETNLYITESRRYFPSKYLCKFVEFRWFNKVMIALFCFQLVLLILISSLLGSQNSNHAVIAISLGLSVTALAFCLSILCLYGQHLYVIHDTLPIVLSQPIKPNLGLKNQHLEVAITSQEAVYMQTQNRAYGLVSQTSTGKIPIQFLSTNAAATMYCARMCSIVCFVSTAVMGVWAVILFIASAALDTD
jgi:hypothetical protein